MKTVHESDNLQDISYAEYREMLIKSVKDILEILGYDVEKELLIKTELVNSSYFREKEQY